jgi:hypothetical protein
MANDLDILLKAKSKAERQEMISNADRVCRSLGITPMEHSKDERGLAYRLKTEIAELESYPAINEAEREAIAIRLGSLYDQRHFYNL